MITMLDGADSTFNRFRVYLPDSNASPSQKLYVLNLMNGRVVSKETQSYILDRMDDMRKGEAHIIIQQLRGMPRRKRKSTT